MNTFFTQTTSGAYLVREAFRSYNRDYYPMGVYAAIYDYIQETHGDGDLDIDVIAWCCDISETDLESANQPLRAQGLDDDELHTLDDLVSTIADETTILYVDEDNEIVYHFAY